MKKRTHVFDDDGCCEFCGFDGAEEWHLRVFSTPPHAREPKPDYAIYCDVRTAKESAPGARKV